MVFDSNMAAYQSFLQVGNQLCPPNAHFTPKMLVLNSCTPQGSRCWILHTSPASWWHRNEYFPTVLGSFYGDTKAEQVLGKALKDIPRDQFVLSTKVGRYGESSFDFTAERVARSVDESLTRLQVSYIDIIQCHDIEFTHLDQVGHDPHFAHSNEEPKAFH